MEAVIAKPSLLQYLDDSPVDRIEAARQADATALYMLRS